MAAGANSVDVGGVLAALMLFGLLGLIGQGIRAVVGLKNAGALNANTPASQSVFSAAYLLVSLMIGFIAGVLAGIALKFQDLTKIDQSSWQQLLGIIASGYVGADFVENTINLVIPGAQPGQNSAPGGSPPKAAAPTSTAADLSQLKAQIFRLASPARSDSRLRCPLLQHWQRPSKSARSTLPENWGQTHKVIAWIGCTRKGDRRRASLYLKWRSSKMHRRQGDGKVDWGRHNGQGFVRADRRLAQIRWTARVDRTPLMARATAPMPCKL